MPKARNNEGSIRTRETAKGVVYDVQLTVRDRKTGLSRRIFKGGFSTQKEALAWRSKTMHESEARGLLKEKPIRVPEVVDAWIAAKGMMTPTTRGVYERSLRNHVRPRLNVRVSALTPKVIREFLDGTASAIASHGTDGTGTNRAAMTMLKTAMKWAARHDVGLIDENPLQDFSLSTIKPATRGEAMTLDDAALLLKAAKGQPSEIAWRLLLETGARRGEITGLNWSEINFRTGVVTIRKIASPESDGRNTSNRTKGKARREIPLSAALLAALSDLKTERAASPSDPVVLGSRGRRRASFSAIRYWWKRDLAAAGLSGYTPHSLRHTFATTALAAGVPVNVVSSILGHASTAVTTEIYAHVTGEMQRSAILVVADEIAKVAG